MVGMLMGSGIAAAVTTFLSPETLQDWGWRVPFLLGGIIGGISILLRRNLPHSKHFQRHHERRETTSPLLQAFTTNRREMIQAILFASAYGVVFYLPLVYLPEWLHSEAGMPRDLALRINTAAMAILLILIPLTGWLSDRFVRRTHFIAGAMAFLVITAIPLYVWLAGDGPAGAIIVQFVSVIVVAVPLGVAPAMFVELFPAADRLSGYSVAYNLGLGVVGGATPMFATWLIDVTGLSTAPAGLLCAAGGVAVVVLLWMHDGSREPLP
jgi:MHS family proline/betaine transporter-like MFS transporter